jgi:hypothetical protein
MQLAIGLLKLNIGTVLGTFMQIGRSSMTRKGRSCFGGVQRLHALCCLTKAELG